MAVQEFPEYSSLQGPRDRPGVAPQPDGSLALPSPTQQTSASLDTLWLPGKRLGGRDPGIRPGVGLAKLLMEDLVALQVGLMWSTGLAGRSGSQAAAPTS